MCCALQTPNVPGLRIRPVDHFWCTFTHAEYKDRCHSETLQLKKRIRKSVSQADWIVAQTMMDTVKSNLKNEQSCKLVHNRTYAK